MIASALPQIRDISKAVPAEVLIYGRLPLMLMENCVIKNRTGTCTCQTGTVRLVDRVGEEFPVVKDPGTCRNVLLNGKKLYLLDKKDVFRGIGRARAGSSPKTAARPAAFRKRPPRPGTPGRVCSSSAAPRRRREARFLRPSAPCVPASAFPAARG